MCDTWKKIHVYIYLSRPSPRDHHRSSTNSSNSNFRHCWLIFTCSPPPLRYRSLGRLNEICVRVCVLGERRLEIRCDGVGPAVFVDIHVGRIRGHGGYHPAGTHAVRRPDTDWQKVQWISNVSTTTFIWWP